ncbi:MAG: hypothetical protein Q8K98_02255 [Bacteroidota bacterium]|nr:hypothetical protein [Bacteroidota bacterium]
MTDLEEKIFLSLFSEIGNNAQKFRDVDYSIFPTLCGVKAQGNLMILGRAPNGWYLNFSPKSLSSQDSRDTLLLKMRESVDPSKKCPMQWDTDYNINLSPFWRTIRQVSNDLDVADITSSDWKSYLIWSNLYRIAPLVTGNPSSRIRNLQFKYCQELMEGELIVYRPKRLLLLTGMDWASPFLMDNRFLFRYDTFGKYVQAFGSLKVQRDGLVIDTVVSKHPQGKPERTLSQEIIQAFQKMRAGS